MDNTTPDLFIEIAAADEAAALDAAFTALVTYTPEFDQPTDADIDAPVKPVEPVVPTVDEPVADLCPVCYTPREEGFCAPCNSWTTTGSSERIE
jgi:hypothetical protein